MRSSTSILMALDRLMPNLPPQLFVKGKEKAKYHRYKLEPFAKYNLLETTSIWAYALNQKNREALTVILVAERNDWHAFIYLKDHHYQMLKLASSSTVEDKVGTPTLKGYSFSYPIDCLYHHFHENWKLIPN